MRMRQLSVMRGYSLPEWDPGDGETLPLTEERQIFGGVVVDVLCPALDNAHTDRKMQTIRYGVLFCSLPQTRPLSSVTAPFEFGEKTTHRIGP